MEKGGPPVAADGSLDYAEMEDPFTILSVFLPDQPSKPLLTPIWPTLPSTNPEEPALPGPINLAPDRPLYQPSVSSSKRPPPDADGKRPQRRHWTITRSTATRGKGKEKEEEEVVPPWKTPREPHTVDWGAYSILVDQVACENHVRDVGVELGSVEKLLQAIKQRLEGPKLEEYGLEAKLLPGVVPTMENYWEQKAKQAEDYIIDVVYGGVDGLAYIRSLAEFCKRPEGMVSLSDLDSLHHNLLLILCDYYYLQEFDNNPPTYSALGKPLAQWVAENVVDHVTEGRHNLLRQASLRLRASQSPLRSLHAQIPIDPTIARLTDLAHHLSPLLLRQLYDLRQIATHKLDMASLIQTPAELFLADDVWAGAEYLKEQKKKMEEVEEEKERKLKESPEENAADYLAFAIKSHEEGDEREDVKNRYSQSEKPAVQEGPEVIEYALKKGADMIGKLSTSVLGKRTREEAEKEEPDSGNVKMEIVDVTPTKFNPADGEDDDHEPHLKKFRLNLLALAKRAPLDTIARLPADLVPAHIRAYVPTLATIPPTSPSQPSASSTSPTSTAPSAPTTSASTSTSTVIPSTSTAIPPTSTV